MNKLTDVYDSDYQKLKTAINQDSMSSHYLSAKAQEFSFPPRSQEAISPPFTPRLSTPVKTGSYSPSAPLHNSVSSSSKHKGKKEQKSTESTINLYETPQKPKKAGKQSSSLLRTAMTTKTSTPHQPVSEGPSLFFKFAQSKKPERKSMIVDEWALHTESQVKVNIILNEFFKMVRPQYFAGKNGVRGGNGGDGFEEFGESPVKYLKVEEM